MASIEKQAQPRTEVGIQPKNYEKAIQIEYNILGVFGFLRSEKKLFVKHTEEYKELKKCFSEMNPEEARKYAANHSNLADTVSKLYGIDIMPILEKMDKNIVSINMNSSIVTGAVYNAAVLSNTYMVEYFVKNVESNNEKAKELVDAILSGPAMKSLG